ncbi:MAG: Hsp20/alpha crystallin family protein [Coriobacteriia bacterium]|nr:Hsp20/alpha crystallin family protein [Coriobacteriia bacterium]
MAIVRWDPFGEALRMQRDMDRIFSRLGAAEVGGESVAWMPKVDVKRKDDDIVVRAELPGIDAQNVEVEVTDGVLTIRGERKQEEKREGEDWLVCESCYGSFERSLTIPESVDPATITAEYKDGILEVHVPKALEAAKPRTTKIEIGGSSAPKLEGAPEGEGK